jgi:hypothetical protein
MPPSKSGFKIRVSVEGGRGSFALTGEEGVVEVVADVERVPLLLLLLLLFLLKVEEEVFGLTVGVTGGLTGVFTVGRFSEGFVSGEVAGFEVALGDALPGVLTVALGVVGVGSNSGKRFFVVLVDAPFEEGSPPLLAEGSVTFGFITGVVGALHPGMGLVNQGFAGLAGLALGFFP